MIDTMFHCDNIYILKKQTPKEITHMNLFTVEKAVHHNIITLLRDITLDDVDAKDLTNDLDANLKYVSCVSVGKALTLKQDVIDSLIDAMGIEISIDKRFTCGSDQLSGITDGWNSRKQTVYAARAKTELKFTGLRSEATKKKRYLDTIDSTTVKYNENAEDIIANALAKMTKALKRLVIENNNKAKEQIKRVLVNLNVDKAVFDVVLSAEEKIEVAELDEEERALNDQISMLKVKLKHNKDKVYNLKRKGLRGELCKQLSNKGLEMLESLDPIMPDESLDMFLGN